MNPWIGFYAGLYSRRKEIGKNIEDLQEDLSKDDKSCQDAIMSLVLIFCIMIIGTIVSVVCYCLS